MIFHAPLKETAVSADQGLPHSIDDTRFSNIGVTDDTNANLVSVFRVKSRELPKEAHECGFTEGFGEVCVENEGWELRRQDGLPTFLKQKVGM